MIEVNGERSDVTEPPVGPAQPAAELDDSRVVRAVQEYLAALEAGQQPDRQEFLARHADIAAALAGCLAGLEFVQSAASQLHAPAGQALTEAGPDVHPAGPLGDFQIVREVGRGGMGIVYEAVQVSLGRRVALKVLPFAAALDTKQLQRFKNEAQAAAGLHHQHIVPVYAVGCERGMHFYAMQFIDGQTLAQTIADCRLRIADSKERAVAPAGVEPTGPYTHEPADESAIRNPQSAMEHRTAVAVSTEPSVRSAAFFRTVARLGVQAAEALEHAHQLGVVHRDIKPANLLVDGRGNLWVTDFGLAHCQSQQGLTMTGDLVGTLRYMSPEQALANRALVDHRTDVYSLGATLYELLTLEPAFPGRDRQELLRQIAFEEPRPPRSLNRAVPAELETIVLKAMEKDPAERYATAQELADDLERWLKDEPIRARRPTLFQRGRKWARRHAAVVWSVTVCLLVALVLTGAGLGWMAGERAARRDRMVEAFDAALEEGVAFLQAGDVPRARAAVQRATGLLTGAGGDQVLQQRLDRVQADLEMATELEAARLEKTQVKDGHFDAVQAEPLYARAFRKYNLPVLQLDADEAVRRIAASPIREQLLVALTDWSRLRPDPAEQKQFWAILHAADDDPWRLQVYGAVERNDLPGIKRLFQEPKALEQPPERLVIAGDYLAGHDLGAAVDFLRKAQQRHPDDFWINNQLGFYLGQLKPPRPGQALAFYRAALALRPENPGAHINVGLTLNDLGDFAGAEAEYREAIRLMPEYAEAHNDLGALLCDHTHDYEGAAREFRLALDHKPDRAPWHVNLGKALRGQHKLAEAEAEYRTAIGLQPRSAAAHDGLGNVFKDGGLTDQAIAEHKLAIKIDAKFAGAHYNLGLALCAKGEQDYAEARERAKGEFDGAIREFRRALDLGKRDAATHTDHGNALFMAGRLDDACAEFRLAIGIEPDFYRAHIGLGNVLKGKGRVDDAIVEYRKAIQLKPDEPIAHNDLASALLLQSRLDEASAEYQELIRLNKEDAEAHCNLGMILIARGQFRQAADELRRGHELGSRRPRWPHRSAPWLPMAETLVELDKRIPGSLKEKAARADVSRRLAQARRCHVDNQLYAAAARWYWLAFSEEPGLAEDLGARHSYNAACIAALAARGRAGGANQRDEGERAFLHTLAFTWLRQSMAAWGKHLQDGRADAHLLVQEQAGHALDDKDLASVRDPGSLARLPADERRAWQRLWADLRQNLANSHNTLGTQLARLGKRREAAHQYQRALALRKRLTTDFPAVPQYEVDLGAIYGNLGHLLRAGDRPSESLPWYEHAIRTLTTVYHRHPQLLDDRRLLRNSHLGRAMVYQGLGKYALALKDWDRVIELSPQAEQPGHRGARAWVRMHAGQVTEAVSEAAALTKSSHWSPAQWYDLARIYGLASVRSADKKQEYADRAMDLLHRAVKAGFQDAALMAKDTELDPLRARDDFKKLLAELAEKAVARPGNQR
jgi:serine/threonine protein kinase/Tfp pilus assembly protein PilF